MSPFVVQVNADSLDDETQVVDIGPNGAATIEDDGTPEGIFFVQTEEVAGGGCAV